jgi:hypothetical protein
MGWGAPLGFSSGPSPFDQANSAGPGEPGYFLKFRAMPTAEHPQRGRVSFPCGRATFDSPEDARRYRDHPGSIRDAAKKYLESVGGCLNEPVALLCPA